MKMIAFAMAFAALTAGSFGSYALSGSGVPGPSVEKGLPAITGPVQTCLDGSISAGGCAGAQLQLARGNECPASSGAYCSDEFPYCCGTPGNYYCAKDVNSC